MLIIVLGSCREDFEFAPATGTLEFSKDTVFLDTVFTNIGSSTYTLKVYNRSSDDILIPQVMLEAGTLTKYRLNVNGEAGTAFENIPLRARDSLFVFIETTFDASSTVENEFLHTDKILFGDNGNYQQVPLVTLVRDAIFLFPRTQSDGSKETLLLGLDDDGNEIRIEGFVLEDEELQFTKEKPYVIYGYAAVAEDKILTINAGSRVYFHKNSGILVGSGGSLQVQGAVSMDTLLMENEVIFEGDRLEPEFEDVPGQWGTIWLASGSTNNSITNLTLKNATVGLLVDGDGILNNPTLQLSNCQVYNSSTSNLWSRTSKIDAQNTVLGNSGGPSLYLNLGGDYNFKHCTIANYWTSGFRNTPSLLMDNTIEVADNQFLSENLVNASFSNCIIDGNKDLELILIANGQDDFNYQFKNCSIKFNDFRQEFVGNPLYDFENESIFQEVLLNPTVSFLDTSKNNFQLTQASEVIDIGGLETAQQVPQDILGIDRTQAPDLGAFEFSPQN